MIHNCYSGPFMPKRAEPRPRQKPRPHHQRCTAALRVSSLRMLLGRFSQPVVWTWSQTCIMTALARGKKEPLLCMKLENSCFSVTWRRTRKLRQRNRLGKYTQSNCVLAGFLVFCVSRTRGCETIFLSKHRRSHLEEKESEHLYEVDVVVTKPMTWQESEDLPPVCFIENGESGRREFTLATFMRSCLQQTTFIEVTFESQLRDRKLRQLEFHKVLQEHKPNSGSLLLYNGSEFCAAPSRRPNHTRLLWVSKSQVMSFETRLERIRRDAAEQAAQADRIRREEAEQAAQADRIRREEAEQAAQAERVRREEAEQRREDAIKALQQLQKQVEQLRKSDASSAWQGERSK